MLTNYVIDKLHMLLQTPNYKLQINIIVTKWEFTEADKYVMTDTTKYYLRKQ